MRWLLALLSALSLASCEKTWTTPVADIRCGALTLRIEERGHDTGFPSGAVSYAPVLRMNDGRGWRIVDDFGANSEPYAYARLVPPHVAYRQFRVYEVGSYEWHIVPWALYVNPDKITVAEYKAIGDCLESKLPDVDAAWDKATPDRHYRLSSMLHVAYDMRFTYADRTTLGMKWECPNGAFIKTLPPDSLVVCMPGDISCGTIGRVTDNATVLQVYGTPKDFYAACRDEAGRTLYETLRPQPMQKN